MRIYNTLSRKIEEFVPREGKKVNFFVCGPTVYDFAHIGNAKTYTQFDFIVRYLRFRGYDVFYLQNITDIDDKIIKRSEVGGKTWDVLAKEYEQIYLADMRTLHNTSVNKYARATDYIPQIVNQVKILLSKGYGYETSDGIYFDISKFPDYGELSRRTEADQNAGVSRIDESFDKKNKNDFCLWKFSKLGEPFWETELGRGRPGWHIEDTAITETFFGPQYDIHGAAVDLIFPHHEAEIAQMEAISGKRPLARFWMHVAFLNVGSQKMSKSRGNFMTAREALDKYGYRLLRFFFTSAHYRTALDFSEDALSQAGGALKRLDDFTRGVDPVFDDSENRVFVQSSRHKVERFLDDDFDTPKALAAIFDFIRAQNERGKSGRLVFEFFQNLNAIFDFFSFEEETIEQNIQRLLAQREEMRREKKFSESDNVRKRIEAKGYTIRDTASGPKVRKN